MIFTEIKDITAWNIYSKIEIIEKQGYQTTRKAYIPLSDWIQQCQPAQCVPTFISCYLVGL